MNQDPECSHCGRKDCKKYGDPECQAERERWFFEMQKRIDYHEAKRRERNEMKEKKR